MLEGQLEHLSLCPHQTIKTDASIDAPASGPPPSGTQGTHVTAALIIPSRDLLPVLEKLLGTGGMCCASGRLANGSIELDLPLLTSSSVTCLCQSRAKAARLLWRLPPQHPFAPAEGNWCYRPVRPWASTGSP